MENPLVYIVIVNWRNYTDTLECLRSVYKIDYRKYKVVLVDNESENDEARGLKSKFPKLHLITNSTNKGFAAAANQGIKYAITKGTDLILLLNNDTVVHARFLKHLIVSVLANPKSLLSSKILYYKTNKIQAMGGRLSVITGIPRMIGQGKTRIEVKKGFKPDFLSGCVLLISREAVKTVGLLDPEYFAYYEDVDYCFRARKAGFNLVVVDKSLVWHKGSQSTTQRPGKIGAVQSYLHAKNGVLFGVKNLKGFSKFVYLANQFSTRPLLFMIYKCDNNKARLSYLKGLFDSTRFLRRKN